MHRHTSFILVFAGVALGMVPAGTSVCDYYTPILLGANNGSTQLTFLTLLVNTALIGNYTQPNVGVTVNGILNPSNFNGSQVNLLPYFNGSLDSTNRGGDSGVSINFLDDGGADPLKQNKPCNGKKDSHQCLLVNHLYEFFGALLGCSYLNTQGFPGYDGSTSMYQVHKFMDLDPKEFGYFVTQVGLAAASFGAASDDVAAVGMSLEKAFGLRCSQPATILPNSTAELQSICINNDCPIAPNDTCSSYAPATSPNMSTSGSSTGSGPKPTGAGALSKGTDMVVVTVVFGFVLAVVAAMMI